MVRTVYHNFKDHVEQGTASFIASFWNQSGKSVHYFHSRLYVKPNLLESKVCLYELGVKLSDKQQMFFNDDFDCCTEGVWNLPEFELRVQVDKFLN